MLFFIPFCCQSKFTIQMINLFDYDKINDYLTVKKEIQTSKLHSALFCLLHKKLKCIYKYIYFNTHM